MREPNHAPATPIGSLSHPNVKIPASAGIFMLGWLMGLAYMLGVRSRSRPITQAAVSLVSETLLAPCASQTIGSLSHPNVKIPASAGIFMLGWLMGLEPTTTGITIQGSTN
jgi:hypothetical protein